MEAHLKRKKCWRFYWELSHITLDLNMKVFYQYFSLQQNQCLVIGHKQTALKVSQVKGGVSESEPAGLQSSVKVKRHFAFRQAKSDAPSEEDELNWERVNLRLRDTAWHLSVFDMATCDVDEVIASLAGETYSGTQRDAAFSSAVYRLSHHAALQTSSICCCDVTHHGSSWWNFPQSLEGVVTISLCACGWEKNSCDLVCVFVLFIAFAFLCIFFFFVEA